MENGGWIRLDGYTVKERLLEFLREDVGNGDITSQALIPKGQTARAVLYYKELGIVSGLSVAETLFMILGCEPTVLVSDGERVKEKEGLMTVSGSARALLQGERLALNIVGRMAGIATRTRDIVSQVREVNDYTKIAATRKTLPGLRQFDKEAVQHGGGDPHRFGLDDCVLIKDNHLELVPSITEAVKRARDYVSFTKKIEVEVRTLDEALEAAQAGADIIMFDNATPEETKEWLEELTRKGFREKILYESSGGITFQNVIEYAKSGVDIISLGALTHSVRSLDVKFEVEMVK